MQHSRGNGGKAPNGLRLCGAGNEARGRGKDGSWEKWKIRRDEEAIGKYQERLGELMRQKAGKG